MPDASWNTYTPVPATRFPTWLKVLGALALLFVLLLTTFIAYLKQARRQGWPLAVAIATRLATDDGARDLYAKNPDLRTFYPTDQAFLDAVRPLRAGLVLSPQEPVHDRRGFITFVGPAQARLRVRGEGGTWMDVTILRRIPFGPQPKGEGIASLFLAKDREGLREQLRQVQRARFAEDWQRYREIAGQLGREDARQGLLARPDLHRTPAEPGAFAGLCQQRRQGLASLPATLEGARGRARLSSRSGPFGHDIWIACPLDGGGSLELHWHDGGLKDVILR